METKRRKCFMKKGLATVLGAVRRPGDMRTELRTS